MSCTLPCATVPADLGKWCRDLNIHAWIARDGEYVVTITSLQLMGGGADAMLRVMDEQDNTLLTVSVSIRGSEHDEMARMVLRAAFLLGLVRTSGGQPR